MLIMKGEKEIELLNLVRFRTFGEKKNYKYGEQHKTKP